MDEYKTRLSDYLTAMVREELAKYDSGFTDEMNAERGKNAEVLGYKLSGKSDVNEAEKKWTDYGNHFKQLSLGFKQLPFWKKLNKNQKEAISIALIMGGNMTGAVEEIEKIKKGLSRDKKVKNALRVANESINEARLVGYDKSYLDNAKKKLKVSHEITDIEYKKTRQHDKFVKISYKLKWKPGTRLDTEEKDVNVFYDSPERLKMIGKTLKLKLKESVKESDLGLTYKRGKTVKVKHKKSGKTLVIVDKPVVRKEYEKIGYFAESVNEKVDPEMKKIYQLLIKYGNNAKDAAAMIKKNLKYVNKAYRNSSIRDKAVVLVGLSGIGESVNEKMDPEQYHKYMQYVFDTQFKTPEERKMKKSIIKKINVAQKKKGLSVFKESVKEAVKLRGKSKGTISHLGMPKASKGVEKLFKIADEGYGKVGGQTVDSMSANLFKQLYNKASDDIKIKLNKKNEKQLVMIIGRMWNKFGKNVKIGSGL